MTHLPTDPMSEAYGLIELYEGWLMDHRTTQAREFAARTGRLPTFEDLAAGERDVDAAALKEAIMRNRDCVTILVTSALMGIYSEISQQLVEEGLVAPDA